MLGEITEWDGSKECRLSEPRAVGFPDSTGHGLDVDRRHPGCLTTFEPCH